MIPLASTYRLQFHAGFTFSDAARIVPYLHELGITHVYASPYLKARPGSTHGYDVIDHCALNPELGRLQEYEAFLAALAQHGMSHILDTVPNHVGVATNGNVWWNDVLAKGKSSRYAHYFDIAWEGSPRPQTEGKLLLPVLGAPCGEVLDKGELQVVPAEGGWAIAYYDRRFPLSPESEPLINARGGADAVNHSPALLDELLQRQHYRLAWWRTAPDEINYRRFFDINDLAALAQEHQEVFDATHAFTLRLVAEGKVAGLRIDHPDGLYDPRQYFQRLQEGAGGNLYVVAEKILAMEEELPTDWLVAGTSGYDFLNLVNGLFVDSANAGAMTTIYQELSGQQTDFADLIYQKKKLILEIALASELRMLGHRLDDLAQRDRHSRDFTLSALLNALRETIACFPVYRTYITGSPVSETDRRVVEIAIQEAKRRNPAIDASIFHFLRDTLLLRFGPEPLREEQVRFAGKFQQLTAPTTAKGIEDTAFYIDHHLISLNEVGGDPATFGLEPQRVHRSFQDRQRRHGLALSPLSTHDTKRSEDLRARLNVLSEIPEEWAEHARRWYAMGGADAEVSRNDLYLLFQTLVGAWPPGAAAADETFIGRIQAYMQKALREAKVRTSWTRPDAAYEEAVSNRVARLARNASFLADFLPFQQRIARLGLLNSLSQTLVRLAAPGVPDTYQGTELWDWSLVDPDNRRPVDYDLRRRLLAEVQQASPESLLANEQDPRLKLYVTWKTLAQRRSHPELFSTGEYVPIRVEGPLADHVFAFLRRRGEQSALAVVPRLMAGLLKGKNLVAGEEVWAGTRLLLPAGLPRMTHLFTGAAVSPGTDMPVGYGLGRFPVALFVAEP